VQRHACTRSKDDTVGFNVSELGRDLGCMELQCLGAKGKVSSSNRTWRDVITLLVDKSRHLYPLCSCGYPIKNRWKSEAKAYSSLKHLNLENKDIRMCANGNNWVVEETEFS
jgi:hypothetical protein